jgi:glyoxalase family protein
MIGLHHVSVIVSDLKRTVAFYETVLGLVRVKRTVMPEDPAVPEVYLGAPGALNGGLISLAAFPDAAAGNRGIGGAHHLAFRVGTEAALLRWKRHLTDRGLAVRGPHDCRYFQSITLQDPEGLIVEIATDGPGFDVDGTGLELVRPPRSCIQPHRDEAACTARTWPEPIPEIDESMRLLGLHHVTAISSQLERVQEFYAGVVGLYLIKRTLRFDDPTAEQNYFGDPAGSPGTILGFYGYAPEKMRAAQQGTGLPRHVALTVGGEDELLALAGRLDHVGVRPSPIKDFTYFRAIRFRDPDGLSLLAVSPEPGFAADELPGELGRRLCLPLWLESQRSDFERRCELG